MKFEDSSLTSYLVKNLQPLTEADPLILADYVAALLKKDKPIKELQTLCAESLVEFLGQGTTSFITSLFQAIEEGSIVSTAKSLDSIDPVETSSSLGTLDRIEPNRSSLKTEDLSPSGGISDSEEKEITDDDDDDRNHKHRRRETHSQFFEKEVQEQSFRRQNRKRNRPFDNGHMFLESDPQSSGSQYNPVPFGTDLSSKFGTRRPGLAPLPRAHFESSQRTRVNQAIRGEGGNPLDLSTPLGRLPNGRGRGRAGLWSQHDSRFTNVGTLDFQMASQGPTPNLFAGRGLLNAASTQNASWGAFRLVPGMSNRGLDTLHPLLQGPLRPPINAPLSIGIPHQRCRDFEERGFCLRGDMCPMEHGVNRIVVEDVQSLSQFNLPVSVPSTRLLGKPAGTGSLPTVSTSSSLLTNGRGLHGKSSTPGMNEDGLGMNVVLPGSASAGDADLYDPDQPLWNNNCPEAPTSLLRLPSPKIDDAEPLWNDDGVGSDCPGRNISTSVGSQDTHSSVWGRIGKSGNKVELTGKNDSSTISMGYLGNETKEGQAEGLRGGTGNVHQRKWTVSEDVGPKTKISAGASRLQIDPARTSQKAQRTLFVNGIPLKSNKEEALLSHFQKFGEVIDIYIPLNSERAFVQFSTREEAESALKAPDAVMGNRFIKLWWANRDSIHANGVTSGNTASAATRGVTSTSVPPSSGADRGKENLPSVAPKVSAVPGPDASVPAAVNVRHQVTNGPEDIPSQKKLDNLELLKEEIRLKQQMLDQKRNDFRRQLDRLEKKAVTVKGEATAQQVVKKHKVEMVTDIAKSATPKFTSPDKAAVRPAIEKMRDKNIPVENLASPNSKTTISAPRSLVTSSYQAPIGAPFLMNRFKLDNRPTTFRILPPVPADLANVDVLKEHFSTFGDLSTVELEDAEAHTGTTSSEPSENRSARITFTTRQSAERAFSNGKSCRGHNLQFSWSTTSSNSSNNSCRENSPTPTAKGLPVAEALTKTTSASSTGKSLSGASEAAATTGNGESASSEEIRGGLRPMDLVEAPESIPTTKSCKTQSSKVDNSIHDGVNIPE